MTGTGLKSLLARIAGRRGTTHARLIAAMDAMPEAVILFDGDMRIAHRNTTAFGHLDLKEPQVPVGMAISEMIEAVMLSRGDRRLPVDLVVKRHERHIRRRDATPLMAEVSPGRWQEIVHAPLDDGWTLTRIRDVSELQEARRRIKTMTNQDPLTGLPHRIGLRHRIAEDMPLVDSYGARMVLVSFDVAKFQDINDRYGQAVADEVLRELGRRMIADEDVGETYARLGGDAFAGIARVGTQHDVDDFLGRIKLRILAPVAISGECIRMEGNFGIATYPQDATDADDLMRKADHARHRSKNSPTRRSHHYEPEAEKADRRRHDLATDLWAAIDRGQFEVHYQVQKDIRTEIVTGHEALLRWNHPKLGFMTPGQFIPAAEESGAIVPMSEWVLRKVCNDAAAGRVQGRVSVNVSPIQMAKTDVARLVSTVLHETGLDPARLEIEIPESAIMADRERALLMMTRMREDGVSIAIDDFGVGISSVETLHAFPFDRIKIDRSFLQGFTGHQRTNLVMRSIIALVANLGIPVLVEGIETREHLEMLRGEECAEGQGFLFGRPAPLDGDESRMAA